MKLVWKCDFCSETSNDSDVIKKHESHCSFNPINKKCYTCKYSWDSGYDYSIPECEKKLSTLKGRDDGNCEGWKTDDIQYLRKLKIENICKNLVKN